MRVPRASKGNANRTAGRANNHLDRAPEGEVVTLQDGERVQRWTRPGAIYTHCLDEQILGADNLFIRAPDSVAGLTQRRLEEVEWLLRLQQQLRGPH